MVCDVCGQEFLVRHSCPGPIPAGDILAPPEGFALFYYLGEAWRIVRWDDAAIRRIKDDKRELPYGILIWCVANALPVLLIATYTPKLARQFSDFGGILTLLYLLAYGAALGLTQMGICHLLAKWFCAGEGKFIQIIRPLLLASIVYVALASPLFGALLAGLAWTAVMMMVFQEVHGIEPLTAFLLSAGVGVGLRLALYFLVKTPF
ncbi:MAG TPA: hypothetical protein VK805_07270 [Candidatus Baltobacteraceae bacterium]|nr:hypothetical protein [Candidatus Baltobacteraceae bacterium]